MDDNALRIRAARLSDAPALRAIYAPYVKKTAITFEYTVPDVEEFAARMRATLRRYPYLVAERGGELVGYAYAGPFGTRAAYDWAVERCIYLREDQRHQGTGQAAVCRARGSAARAGMFRISMPHRLPGWSGRCAPDEKQRTVSCAPRLPARRGVFALRV